MAKDKSLDAVSLRTDMLDGKMVAYSTHTCFIVQVGKGTKGAYKTRNVVRGNLGQALTMYKGINCGQGYKKRLLMTGSKKPLLKYAS